MYRILTGVSEARTFTGGLLPGGRREDVTRVPERIKAVHNVDLEDNTELMPARLFNSPGDGFQNLQALLRDLATHPARERQQSWVMMTSLFANISISGSPTLLQDKDTTELLPSAQSLAPLCNVCCCGVVSRTLAVVVMAGLAFAIVVGNVITLTVFMQTRQSHTPQGYLKVSLAIADMMVGVVVVPFSVYTEVTLMVTSAPPVWYQSRYTASPSSFGGLVGPWQPCMLIGLVFAGCTFVSIITIFLMTVERCVAIMRPLHKDTLVTRRRTLHLILLSWAASFLLALAPLIFSNSFTLEYNECSRMCNYAPLWFGGQLPSDTNIMLLFPVFDFTLLGGTLAVNILSFTSIQRYSRQRKLLSERSFVDGGGEGGGPQRPSFSDIKAAKTIGILTFAFTASFSPIAVFVVGNVVGYTWCNFSFFAFWILTGNSCCNVIIYSVRDQRFRKGVTQLFQRQQSPRHKEKFKSHSHTHLVSGKMTSCTLT